MKTTIYRLEDLHKKDVQHHISNVLHHQGLVVFPTETVYGIGGSAIDQTSVRNIFAAKGRPSDNPLIVHISNINDLTHYVEEIPDIAHVLMDTFWPGPLTLVFKKKDIIPMEVTGGLATVAIRMPQHEIALKIIDIAKIPICAPSANLSGKPSSTEFKHAKDDFYGKVDIMIDGGKTNIGIESTVLDLSVSTPEILRPGSITKDMIEEVLGFSIQETSDLNPKDTPKSPGMKYLHYAPKGKVTILKGDMSNVLDYVNRTSIEYPNKKIGFVAPSEYLPLKDSQYSYNLGSLENLEIIASNIFSALRQMDLDQVELIYIPYLPTKKQGAAIMNRLLKAANYRIIEV